MICPHCHHPIPDAEVVRGAASINARRNKGKGSRPGAKGLIRNPNGPGPRKPIAPPPVTQPATSIDEMDRLIEAALQAQRRG